MAVSRANPQTHPEHRASLRSESARQKARRRARLLGALCLVAVFAHCGVPEVVLETDDPFSDTCRSLYDDSCGRPCGSDPDCASGLYCDPSGRCNADCKGESGICGDNEMCSPTGRCEALQSATTTSTTSSGGATGTTGVFITTGSGGQAGAGGSDECAAVREQATEKKRPMDIVVAIDNSASMAGEIVAVQQRINSEFADIIESSGIDFRVIMVSRYGNVFVQNYDGGQFQDSAFAVCIGAPLSTLTCPADADESTPPVLHNPPNFYHHSTDIGSRNLWCRLLEAFDTSDPYPNPRTEFTPIAEDGWQAFLREDAFKVFIAITDDSPTNTGLDGCSESEFTDDRAGAEAFDVALRTL